MLSLALYAAPPVVLLVKHVAAGDKRLRPERFDAVPGVYLAFLVLSLAVTASSESIQAQ